jgi:hypothetical protein
LCHDWHGAGAERLETRQPPRVFQKIDDLDIKTVSRKKLLRREAAASARLREKRQPGSAVFRVHVGLHGAPEVSEFSV